MGKKAGWGALMGAGEGITKTGAMFATEAMRKEADKRTTTRQQSLQDIQNQYNLGVRDEKREYALEAFREGSPEYTARQMGREEKQTDALELLKARGASYGSSGMLSNFNLSQWTPESGRKMMSEVNKLVETEGMLPDEAYSIASGYIELVPKAPSSSLSGANRSKFIAEETALFKDNGEDAMRQTLIMYGLPQERVANMSYRDMITEYQKILRSEYPGQQQPLMGGTSPKPANNDPLGLGLSGQ